MSAWGLAVVLALATFAALWLGCLAVSRVQRTSRCRSAAHEVRALFARAVHPTIIPAFIVAGLLVPSFIAYEVQREGEWPGVLIAALAVAGAARLAVILSRGSQALLAARALVRSWSSTATPLPAEPWGLRASSIDTGLPVVAVAGLLRPHVFVDRRVLETCSPAELAAVAAHERAHVASRDNLRRLLVVACTGHDSEVAATWRIAAERAADERAVRTPRAAADLAAALVRVARIGPAPALPVAAVSTIHDGGSLELRVQRLLMFAPDARQLSNRYWLSAFGAGTALASMIVFPTLPRSLHALLELLVQRLP